jgi:outer membrane protein TolC
VGWSAIVALAVTAGGCSEFTSPLAMDAGAGPLQTYAAAPPLPPPVRDVSVAIDSEQSGADAAAVHPLALSAAVKRALSQNLDLALADAERIVRHQAARAEGAKLLPAVQFGGTAARTDGRVQGSFGDLQDVTFNTFDARAGLVARFNLPAQVNQIVASRRDVDAATLDTMETRQRLLLRVTEFYYDLLVTRVGVDVADQLLQSSRELLKIAQSKLATGLGSGAEVARTEARVADAEQQQADARRLWQQASIRLAVVLRLDPNELLMPTELQLAPWDVAHGRPLDPVRATRRRPSVEAAQTRRDAADARVKAAWWDQFGPEVIARVDENFIGDQIDGLNDRTWFGVFLGWTLSFEKSARLDQAKAEQLRSRLLAARAHDNAVGEIHLSLRDIAAAAKQIPMAQRELASAETNQRLNTARFRGGTAVVVELIDAQDVVARARLNVARTIESYNVAQVRLLAAAGALEPDLLEAAPAPKAAPPGDRQTPPKTP